MTEMKGGGRETCTRQHKCCYCSFATRCMDVAIITHAESSDSSLLLWVRAETQSVLHCRPEVIQFKFYYFTLDLEIANTTDGASGISAVCVFATPVEACPSIFCQRFVSCID